MAKHPKDGSVTAPATLAEELGTSTQTISYYINGKRKPSYDNVIALTKFFGVSADYLLYGTYFMYRGAVSGSNDFINLASNVSLMILTFYLRCHQRICLGSRYNFVKSTATFFTTTTSMHKARHILIS